jgi:thiamine-monophosphate kinase
MDEFELISKIFAPLAGEGSFSLQDDAAVIPPRPGFDLVVTTDAVAEGTDFFAFDPAGSVAQKALRVNLSDLAAKGATPCYYLLGIALPPSITMEWLSAFASGLAADQAAFGILLLGGDTARTEGPLSISVTAFGLAPEGRMIRRAGARAGDDVYVTGTIGDSGGGLAIFKREIHALDEAQRDDLIARYRVPEPPIDFGANYLGSFAGAAIDISDGLIADLGHLARASEVQLRIDADSIPRSEALRAFWGDDDAAIVRAATAGDDYQIAFTAAPSARETVTKAANDCSILVTRIGSAGPGEGVQLQRQGRILPVSRPGYRHF